MSFVEKKVKQLFSHGLLYGLVSSIQNLLGFVLLPLITSYVAPEEFGVYSIILLMASLSGAIFYFGASTALGRFYYQEDSDSYRKTAISTAVLITSIGAAILILLGWLTASKLSVIFFGTARYSTVIILAFVATAFGFLLNCMTLVLRYQGKIKSYVIVMLSALILNLIISYTLLSRLKQGIIAPVTGLAVSNFLSFCVLAVISRSQFEAGINRSIFRQFLVFGIQSSILGLLFYFLDWVDRIILKQLLSLEDVGIYSLGYRIASLINVLIIVPFSLVWAPLRISDEKDEQNHKLMTTVTSYYTYGGVLFIFVSLTVGSTLLSFFFKNEAYNEAFKVFPLVMLGQLFYGYQNIVDYGIYLHRRLGYYILVAIIAIAINIGLNYLIVPIAGFMGAAYVTILTYLISSSLIYIISCRFYKFQIEWKRVSILYFFLTVYYLFRIVISPVLTTSVNTLIFAVVTVSCLFFSYRYWLSEQERNFLREKMKGSFSKRRFSDNELSA